MMPGVTPATPAKKTYTVYLSPTVSIQIQSTTPTIDTNRILRLDGSSFEEWVACIDPDTVPAPASSSGIFSSIGTGISSLFGGKS